MELNLFVFLIGLLPISAGYTPTMTMTSPGMRNFNSLLPSDAVSLLSFKSAADLDNKLLYSLTERFDYCQWRGVKCAQGRVVHLVLAGVGLRGYFAPATLSRLDQLRVLSLENNTLFGYVPDLSPLVNLKSLFLSRNGFSGSLPPSVLSLHRLMVLELSFNNFTGPIPSQINALDRLTSLKLEHNRFTGTVPPLNQSFLFFFNVSGNNLTGPVPFTRTLSRFTAPSFWSNPGLCGEIINRACASHSPFFGSPNTSSSSSQAPLGESVQAQNGGAVVLPPGSKTAKKSKGGGLVLGFTIGAAALILLGLCLVVFSLVMKKRRDDEDEMNETKPKGEISEQVRIQSPNERDVPISNSNFESQKHEETKESKLQKAAEPQSRIPRSGNLVFCGNINGGGGGGESGQSVYTLEQLMRASAELLGRGSIGTTYKAVLDNRLIVTVKRLDAIKTAVTSDEAFEKHMNIVGGLRHPNLVPIRAYFQSKGERLVIYDYQPNGSLFNLIHGSRSSRAKPLHWTSCLKIAEDIAQGLYYIHQSSTLVHGSLKSTNILLGQDFEACLTDYCLSVLSDSSSILAEDTDSSSYKAPEIRKSSRRPSTKSDIYSFGVFLFELLTGKRPSQHPFMAPHDMIDWVRAMREEEEGSEDNRLGMLTEVACVCRVTSPEQRPSMRQVIKMIQEIKETVMAEENDPFMYS